MNLPGRSRSGREGASPEMALSCPPGVEGQRLSHLRSIGSWAPVPGVSPVIHFSKAVTLFGRNTRVVDYCLNSPAASSTDVSYISRIHARIIRTASDYVLVDSSLTGVYVNDIRIQDRVILQEGDTVTFGHPAGKNLLLGSHTRQPNSPFYFLFEHCDCCPDETQKVYGDGRNFPQLIKGPDFVSAGVSHPGSPNLAFAHNVSRPQTEVLPGHVTPCDHRAALAPPLNPALPASSPVTASLPTPPQNLSEQRRFPSSSGPPLRAPCRRASQVLRSASPDYTRPEGNSLAAPESPPLQGNPESGDSVSLSSGSESAEECDRPPPQRLSQQEDGGSDPEGGCVHPLPPSSTHPEVSEAADQDGSPKAFRASGPWEGTLRLTSVFPTETGGASGCVLGPESPALNETDQDEEQAEMDLGPSMEDTACVGDSFASEPGSPAEEMEGVGLAGSHAQLARGSVDECKETLVEKHPTKTSEGEEAEGVESRAASLSSEIQPSDLGPVQQPDSAKRTAEICFSSAEEPVSDSSAQILSQEKVDSERRNTLLPSRNSSHGTQSGDVGYSVDSPEKVAASEDVEMEPPTDAGLEGLDGHLPGRELEPEASCAIPADAEGVCNKASMADVCAEMGVWTDGVTPSEVEVAPTESSKEVDPNQRPGTDDADSKAGAAKEMLLQKSPETLVLFQGEEKDWSEASDATDETLHSKDLLETSEGGGRAPGTDWLQARPAVRGKGVLAEALGTSLPGPPENLGEVISEQCLFQSSKIPCESPVGEGSETEGKLELEGPRSAESSNNLSEVTAVSRLQSVDETSESQDSSLGIGQVPVVGLSGGDPPSYKSGGEGEREGDSRDPPSEEESEVKRSKIGTSAAAANEDAANRHREAEGGLEKEPTGLVEQEGAGSAAAAAADAPLPRSPSPDPAAWASLGWAGSKGDSSTDGLREGRIPHLGNCSLVGTQPPSPKSPPEAGERSGPDRTHLLGCQHVTEDEGGPVRTTVGEDEEEEASPVANAPLAVTKRGFDPPPMQAGSLNGPCSAFSSSSAHAINQLQCPIEVDPQELNSDIVEPENLGNGLEVKSQGPDVGGKLLYLEDPLIQDGASEEPEAPLEQISLPGPGEPEPDVLLPEESSWSDPMAKNPHCMKARGSTALPFPSFGLLRPGHVAVNLPAEPTDDSAEALQLPDGGDGLHCQVPASEAEKEETGQFGPSETDGLHRRRDTSGFNPAEQRANATDSWEAFKEPTEEAANHRSCDLAIQEARAGPRKATEVLEMSLEGQTSSHPDRGSPVRAVSSAAETEAGGPSPSRKKRKRASEESDEEEMDLQLVNLVGWPANSSWGSADDGRAACKDQGFIENTRQDVVQESWPVAGRLPGQPDTATVASPLGEAVKRFPGREASSSPRSGKGECTQRAGTAFQDLNRRPGQESTCQLGNGLEASAGCRGGAGCSEPCEALLQEEEELKSSSRKRLPNEDFDLEGAACHPKKLRRETVASVWGSASDPAASPVAPPPPPPPVKESAEQIGRMIEKFLDQCRTRIPLCSDPMEGNGEALAQIVRNYFKSNIFSNQPATENGEREELEALSSETAAAKGIGCQSERAAGDPGESPGSPKDAQTLEDAPGSPGGRSAVSVSSAREEGKGSGVPGQEDVCHSEEAPFPVEVGSGLWDLASGFPAESPKAEPPEGPLEDDPDTSLPLDRAANSQSDAPSPRPPWSSLEQALGRASGGLLETEWYSPSHEDSGTPTDAAMLWQESSQAAPRETRLESVCPLSPSGQEAPGCRLLRGEPDRGDGPEGSAPQEDSGKAPEEMAAGGDRRGMPAEGGVSPQGSPGGSPDQDKMGSAPREPFPRPPWDSSSPRPLQPRGGGCDPALKTERMDGEPEGQECTRNTPPPPPLGRTPGASAQGAPPTPPPSPTAAEGSAGLLVKEEPVQEEEPQPSVPAESSLSNLCPSQPDERLSPPGKAWEHGEGQAASHQASQEAPWIPGTSGCFPATDPCGERRPHSALALQGDGRPPGMESLGRHRAPLPGVPGRKEPALASPLVPSIVWYSHVPKTLADEQREGPWQPADFGGREPGIPCQSEEAGLAEPSDAECLRVAAAVSCPAPPESKEGVSLSRDPPAQKESHSSCLRERAGRCSPTKWASSEQDVGFQLQECQSVLAEILQALSSVEGVDNTHVEKWRDQIAALQKATKMPQTHIAVVGNTGAGKSCLLNALLDEEAMLPTSAMRACTAVVVEIARGAEGSPYEAEVEFLSREEWHKELEALLEDMKDKAGILKKHCPDRKTEAGAAYIRVKAVYGRVDELEKLEDKQGVTQHLGTVKRICAETAADFRVKIEKFIDSRTDNLREMKGGEFWPIVKCVRIRVAAAEVLRTGAVLVDLPGTRDSNAARDTTAREYLKDCQAVWVTASITRAVDDKTAKELLSANFRRQLFMDGLYGSLAFVCTQTDSFSITDIVRDLDLQDKIRPLEEELQELERQRTQAEMEKAQLYAQLQRQPQPVREGGVAGDSAWLQRHDILEKEFKICALQREKDARLRAISLICVQARNEFSKQRILMDFSAGLQEVSRRAEGEEDGEEEMDEGDSAGEQPVGLQVFTVSSTEYLKLGGKLLCNGQPQVFHDVKDTEIPALKKFAMDTALKHSMVAAEKVIRDVARVLSQMVNYLDSQRTEANAHQAQVQEMLKQALQGLPALLQGALAASSQDLRHDFEALILGSLQNGAQKAKQLSEAIVRGWGSPTFGYPHVTYRAICNHRGVYTSPRYQSVDFNKELAGPILRVLSVSWNEVFCSRLAGSIKAFTAALLDQLSSFFRGLKKKLHQDGPAGKALRAIHAQQMEAARARLLNFSLDQMSSITRKQRTVSRLLIPTIQAGMEPAYAACSQFSGPGYFRRMKEEMERFIHQRKEAIFDSAVEKMRKQLDLIQLSICCSLQAVAQELSTSIRMQFEPLLRPVQKNKEILPELQRLCARVDKICQRSDVDYVLPTAPQPEEPPPGTEAQPGRGDWLSVPAASMDVCVGAFSLPRLSAIEVSKEHITFSLAGDPTEVALPLGSVSRCEGCLPLGCLILHVSAKAALEVCAQCRVRLPSPGLCRQEALVIQEAAQGERQLPRLRDCLAARLSTASRVQELSPQQGRERLLSLGVSCPGQQKLPESAEPAGSHVPSAPEPIVAAGTAGQQPHPPPLLLPWHPHGRKRAWEAVQPQLEKRAKLHPVGPAGSSWLPCSQGAGMKPTSPSAAPPGSCSPEGAFRPDGPPCPMARDPDGEPQAEPSSAGLLWVAASQGAGREPPSVTLKEEEANLPSQKTQLPRWL